MERWGGWSGGIGKVFTRVMPGKLAGKKGAGVGPEARDDDDGDRFENDDDEARGRGVEFTALPSNGDHGHRFSSDDDNDIMERRLSMSSRRSMAPRIRVKSFNKEQKDKLYGKMQSFETGFTIGFLKLVLDLVFLLRIPQYYWLWHVVKAVIFLPNTFFRFLALNDEFYMLDFCYFNAYYTTIISMLVLLRYWFGLETFLHKFNAELFRVGFMLANGPLILSVPLFGNKVVFHDLANSSSLFIHFSPAIMFWTLRWGGGFGVGLIEQTWPTAFQICGDMLGDGQFRDVGSYFWSGDDSCTFTPVQLFVWPALVWLCTWALPYYLIVLYCLEGYLKRNSKTTLYSQTIQEPSGLGWFTKKAPAFLWRECFILQHGVCTVGSGAILGYLLWKSFICHSMFLFGVFVYAFHNGSTYIFRVVAARHVHDAIEDQLDEEEEDDGYRPDMQA